MNISRLKQAERVFLQRYPGGFDNPEIIATRVKKHKPDQMIALVRESFSKESFRHPDLIVQNMIKVISRSSIISVFEKPRFRDFAGALAANERDFLSRGLYELLHGDEQTGFEMVLDVLKHEKLAKWSLMTVCQTYFHPQRDVFVKPTTVKGVIEYFELSNLHYKAAPTWAFYEAYRDTFHEMKSKVDPSLAPTNPAFSGFLCADGSWGAGPRTGISSLDLSLGEDWEDNADRVNALTFEIHHQKSWTEVYEIWKKGFLRFLELGKEISERDLLDGDRYPWLKGYSLAGILIASYEHHQEHFEKLTNPP